MSAPRPTTPLTAWLLIIAMPASAGLLRIWWQQTNVRLGYALSAAERQQTELRTRLRGLEVALSAQLSPTYLEGLGARLGLQPPTPAQQVSAPSREHLVQAELGMVDYGHL